MGKYQPESTVPLTKAFVPPMPANVKERAFLDPLEGSMKLSLESRDAVRVTLLVVFVPS